MDELRWVSVPFRAGLVSSERLESKSSKLAAQGTGAELGVPAGGHPPAFLPLELHTSQCQNILDVLPSLYLT